MDVNKMACIHYEDDMNPWIDCLIYVPETIAEKALEAVRKGVDMFNEETNQEPYGECIILALKQSDIPYLIEFCEYNEDTDEPFQSWVYHVSEVESCDGLKVLAV